MASNESGESPVKRLKRASSSCVSLVDAPQLVENIFTFMVETYNSDPDQILKSAFVDMCVNHLDVELDSMELDRALGSLDSDSDGMFSRQEVTDVVEKLPLMRLKVRSFFMCRQNSHLFPPIDFDFGRTTQQNYMADLAAGVEEMHAKQRVELRGGYHKQNYTRERQKWQDVMVSMSTLPMVPTCEEHPWLIYTCGTPGAGKGYVMNWLSNEGFFPLESIVHVDPDNFKLHMPEWPKYKQKGETSVDNVCGGEANFLADLAQEVALSKGNFVWRDTTLLGADRIKTYMKSIRKRLPNYKIAVFYIFADEKTVRERIKKREVQTGRSVTADFLDKSFADIKKSLTTVEDEVDLVAMIDNSGKAPQPILSSLLTVDRSHSWGKVGEVFAGRNSSFPDELDAIFLADPESPPGMSYSDRTVRIPGMAPLETSEPFPLQPDSWLAKSHPQLSGLASFAFVYASCRSRIGEQEFEGGFVFFNATKEPQYFVRSYFTQGQNTNILQFGKVVSLTEPAKEYVKSRAHCVFRTAFCHKGAELQMWKGPGEIIDGIGDEITGFAFLCKDGRGFFFPTVSLTARGVSHDGTEWEHTVKE